MDITKEEIMAYTDAATKTATALEKIADRLLDISNSQHECQNKLCASLVDMVKINHSLLVGINERTIEQHKDVIWVKWLWTSIAAIVGIGMVVIEIINKIHH